MNNQPPRTFQAGTDLRVGSQDVRVLRELERSATTMTDLVENRTSGKQQWLKRIAPTGDADTDRDASQRLQHEGHVMRLLNRLEQADPDGRRHIPLATFADSIQVAGDNATLDTPALLLDAPAGDNGETLLQSGEGLGEAAGLHIGTHLADVVTLAHLGNFQCGPLTPDRLFWDGQHLVVVAWSDTRDISNAPENERTTSKQADIHALANMVCWLITAQPLPTSGQIAPPLDSALSPPLRALLERATLAPAGLGPNAVATLKSEMERLLGYWQSTDDIYARLEQDIHETRREIKFLSESTSTRSVTARIELVQKIDHFYDQLAIGRRTFTQFAWDSLESALNDLWNGQIVLIDNELRAGHFEQALAMIDSTYAYPQRVHQKLLWRRRVAEIALADPQMARDSARIPPAIREWDRGNLTISTWVNVDKKLFDSLEPRARDAMTNLRSELWIASQVRQFHATPADQFDERLGIISKLEKDVPDGIDQHIAQEREQICNERPHIAAQQQQQARQHHFQQTFADVHQRVHQLDTSLTSATFDTLLEQSSTPDERQSVYHLRARWKRLAEVAHWLEQGDTTRALRQYASIRNLPDDTQAALQHQIVQALLRQAGLQPDTETTFDAAFDRLLQAPITSADDLQQMLERASALLPIVDSERRQRYEALHAQHTTLLRHLATLSDENTPPEQRITAFQQLHALGVHVLESKLLGDSCGAYVIAQQQSGLEQLHAVAERIQADVQAMRQYEQIAQQVQDSIETLRGQVKPIPTRVLEREITEIEQLIPAKEAQQRHHQIWESTAELANLCVQMAHQRNFFNANDLLDLFRQRFSADVQASIAQMPPAELEPLITMASEIARLATTVADAPYAATLMQRIEEQRTLLDERITDLLNFNPRRDDEDTQAERLIAARRLLLLYDAFGGGVKDRTYWEQESAQDEIISRHLRHPNVAIRRMMLRQLHPNADPDFVSPSLDQPPPREGNPVVRYAVAIGAVLIIAALVVIALQLTGGQQEPQQAASGAAQTTTTTPTTQSAADGDGSTAITTTTTTATTAPPAMITLESLPTTPTPTPEPQAQLSIATSSSGVELYPGETASLTLTITDSAQVADVATLSWEPLPDAITVSSAEEVPLGPDSGAVRVDIAVNENASATFETLHFSATTTSAPEAAQAQIDLVVHAFPALMKTALAVRERLDEMLTITVERNVTFRNAPRQAPATSVEVLPEGSTLTLLRLESEDGFLRVRGEVGGEMTEGWVTAQRVYTTYNPDEIPLERYPLAVILGNSENPDNQATLHTSNARDESDAVMVDPQEAELLDIVPLFDPDTDVLWIRVRVQGDEPYDAWVTTDDTNYQELMTTIAAQFEE